MPDSRTKNTARSIVWGFANRFLNLLLPFIIRTILIYFLGYNYVGLSSLFSSILQVLSFAELGFGSAIVFCMYKPMAEGDNKKINAYLCHFRRIYRVVGIVILLAGLATMPFLRYLIKGEVPSDINIYVLFLIFLCNSVISYFVFAYKSSIFSAAQRGDISSNIASITLIIQSIIQIALLCIFKNYYFYIFVVPFFTLMNNIFVGIISKKRYPLLVPDGEIDSNEKRIIRDKVSGVLCQKIGGIVLASVDTIVISAYFGLTTLGIYNNYYYIINALFGFLAIVQTALIPSVGNSIQTESVDKNYDDFKKFHFFYIFIVTWWSVCLLCLYQPFMTIWVKESGLLPLIIPVLLTAYFYTYKFGDITYIYKSAIGLWDKWRFVPLIAAGLNLTVNLILSYFIGLPGIVISSIISLVLVYFLLGSVPLFKFYFKDMRKWRTFLITQIFYMGVAAFVCVGFYFACKFIPVSDGWLRLIVNALLCGLVAPIILLLIYWKYPTCVEARKFTVGIISRFLRRGKNVK